jgi:hypothetical protein
MPNDTILKGPVPLTPIPEGANPYRAIVNGVEHDYEAGSRAAVAPGVKELINAADNFPPAAEEVKPPFAGGGGGGGGVLVVNVVFDSTAQTATLDKTWQEIHDADLSVVVSKGAIAKTALVTDAMPPATSSSLVHIVRTIGTNGGSASIERWTTMSPDGYPELANT